MVVYQHICQHMYTIIKLHGREVERLYTGSDILGYTAIHAAYRGRARWGCQLLSMGTRSRRTGGRSEEMGRRLSIGTNVLICHHIYWHTYTRGTARWGSLHKRLSKYHKHGTKRQEYSQAPVKKNQPKLKAKSLIKKRQDNTQPVQMTKGPESRPYSM